MPFKLADLVAYISTDDTALVTGLASARSAMGGAMSSMGSIVESAAATLFSPITTAARIAGMAWSYALVGGVGAVVGGLNFAVSKASEFNEVLNRVNVVFGPAAKEITDLAAGLGDRFGFAKTEIASAASSIGLIGLAAGQSQEKAANMGTVLAKLAADASSFYDVPVATALEKIESALVGMERPIREFGVLINESTVKAEAMRMGFAGKASEMDDQTKVMARYNLVVQGLSKANGDLERTEGAVANQLRRTWGEVQNLAAEFGRSLLPAVGALAHAFNTVIEDIRGYIAENQADFEAWGAWLADKAGYIETVWKHWPEALAAVREQAQIFATNLKEIFLWILDNTGPAFQRIGYTIVTTMAEAFDKIIDMAKDAMAVLANPTALMAMAGGFYQQRMLMQPGEFTPFSELKLTQATPGGAISRFQAVHELDRDAALARERNAEVEAEHAHYLDEQAKAAERDFKPLPRPHLFAVPGQAIIAEREARRQAALEADIGHPHRFAVRDRATASLAEDFAKMKEEMATGRFTAESAARLREIAGTGMLGTEALEKAALATARAGAGLLGRGERERPTFVSAAEAVKTFQAGGKDTEKEKIRLMENQLNETKLSNELLKMLGKIFPKQGGATYAAKGAR